MYILMIARGVPTNEYPQWGCFEKDQAEALTKFGHKVVVISLDARFRRHRGKLGLHRFENNGVRYYNYVMIPGVLLYKIVGSFFLRRTVYRYYFNLLLETVIKEVGRPDIMYSHYVYCTASGALLKQKYNLPLVGIEHLSQFNENDLPTYLIKEAKFAYKVVDALICVSKTLSSRLNELFGVDSAVVYNMYGFEFESLGMHFKSFNIDSEKPFLFVSTASLIRRKGFDSLIKAFGMAKIDKHRWILNIIGEGEEKSNLENLIYRYDLQNNIFLLGKMSKSEIASCLRGSDAFVLPSRNENFSVAVLEALASGLPVVATDCGGIRECINDNNGIIVPVDNIGEIANALNTIINNYSKYNRTDIANDCRNRFSADAIATQLTDIFEYVVNNFKS